MRIHQRLCGPLLLLSLAVWAQPDPQVQEVDALLKQANAEIREFEKGGGKKDDPQHPVSRWVESLWALGDKQQGTPAAAKAKSEAVHLLVHAGRFTEVRARTDRVPFSEELAWELLPQILFEAAGMEKDFGYLFEKLNAAAKNVRRKETLAAVHYRLGVAHRDKLAPAQAQAALEAAINAAPGSNWSARAKDRLHELLNLSPGKSAPAFSATTRDRARIQLADYRGRAVALVFWATH
jgi:hypothetical protein